MIQTVQEAMTENVVYITSDQTVEAAARIMARFSISSLIVHEDDEIVGILTEKDIMHRVVAVGGVPKEVHVSDIMTSDLITCNPETTLEDACKTMQSNRIKKLAVSDSDGIKGIISLTDIAQLQPELMEKIRDITLNAVDEAKAEDIINLMKRDEGQHLEFKSSLRIDKHRKEVNPALELTIMKTICAFLNSEGGTLLIGLSDEKEVVGIEEDYKSIKNMNRDGFQNHLMSLISNYLGNFYLKYIHIVFHNVLGKDMCQVNVQPSSKPVFLTNKGKQEFYVRTGNASRPFKISEAADYLKERWG
ncbi:MAG: CBS domain-containing protein [Candidatus Bathyarchaeota archaeon]|nr:CBS domain-containing protein [Candidatus Bathyarchaeota archaeon]